MNDPVGMPGIGGSLGQCALCGGNFLFEILMGKTVKTITVDGCEQTLFAHKSCIKRYSISEYKDLPLSSPLRQAYERALAKKKLDQPQT